jgi:hypothetical protein
MYVKLREFAEGAQDADDLYRFLQKQLHNIK